MSDGIPGDDMIDEIELSTGLSDAIRKLRVKVEALVNAGDGLTDCMPSDKDWHDAQCAWDAAKAEYYEEKYTQLAGWEIPETAPKDGTVILADFGWPWPVPAAYSTHDENWVTALLQMCPMEGGGTDTYFENEYEQGAKLKRWMPMPDLSV